MSLNLNKLANKLDEALSNETSETLNKFLTDKRMSNNKQSSIDWLEDKLTGFLTFEDMEAVKNYDNLIEQAKAMHKEEIEKAFYEGNHNSVDYFNMDDFRIKEYEQYYNETFGGNK